MVVNCLKLVELVNIVFAQEETKGDLLGRPVNLVDIEHILCEYSKYHRIKYGKNFVLPTRTPTNQEEVEQTGVASSQSRKRPRL